MKKFILCLLIFSSVVFAQEAAKYNFATMQVNKNLDIVAGESGTGKIYLYNIDGNRITHISLQIIDAPNWDIKIQPELKEVAYQVGGTTVSVSENLFVEPANATETIPEIKKEGYEYILVPGRGYAPAKLAQIIINVPAHEEIGKTANVTVNTIAEWLGQTGTAAIKQTRDFTFGVRVQSESMEERIIPAVPQENISRPVQPPPLAPQEIPVLHIIIIILVGVIIFMFLRSRK